MGKEYEQKYRKEWKNEPELKACLVQSKQDSTKAFCKICNKEITAKLPHLKRHGTTEGHKKNTAGSAGCSKLPAFVAAAEEKHGHGKQQDDVAQSELLLAGFIAEHNLPISVSDHRVPLVKKVCPDSEVAKRLKSARTRATKTVIDVIGAEEKQRVSELMRNNPFSLILDG